MNLLTKIAPGFKTLDNLAEQLANQAQQMRAFAEQKRDAANAIKIEAQRAIERADAMLHEARVAEILAEDIGRTLERAEVETAVMV